MILKNVYFQERSKSDNHDIYSMKINKIALSANDEKRIVMRDKIHTKALQ